MKYNGLLRLMLSALLMLVAFGLQAQEVDDLQEYLDKLAAEQTPQARQKTIQKGDKIDIPVGIAEVDLSKYTSRKKELTVKVSVKFVNGTLTASSDFAGGTSLLKVYGGASVVLGETASIDASAATMPSATKAPIQISANCMVLSTITLRDSPRIRYSPNPPRNGDTTSTPPEGC